MIRDEIVDVLVDAASPTLTECVSEALWNTWLPDGVQPGIHAFTL